MPQFQWFLYGQPQGLVDRPAGSSNLRVMCQRCGDFWASLEPQSPSDDIHWWVVSHKACPKCSLGSLVGADWTVHPYTPHRLSSALLRREVMLATSHPDTYNP